MSNLVTTAMESLAPQFISRLAAPLGLSPGLVEQGLGAIVPTLLGGALKQSGTTAGAEALATAIGRVDPNHTANIASGVTPIDPVVDSPSIASDSAIAALLGGGTASQGILGSLSSVLGMKSGVVSTLASVAAPIVLGTIGKAIGGAPTPGAVKSLLGDQRANILAALPAGIGSLLGFTPHEPTRAYEPPDPVPPVPPSRPWWPWLLAALVLLGLIYALTQCSRREPVTQAPAPAPTAAVPADETVNLPGGATITVPPGSIGYQLAQFLASSDPAPKTFVFDHLNFSTASDALTPESSATVAAIASILKAYPNAAAAIVGYTDNQGDPASNRTLSLNRAKVVTQALISSGIAANRLTSNGLGEGSPIADNNTEEGRAKNRRTELTITKK